MSPQDLIASDFLQCEWATAPYLFFSENVFSPLIYYSHLFPALAGLILGAIVLFQGRKQLLNKVLAFIAIAFSVWSLFDLILWATDSPDLIMFFWSSLIYFDVLIYAAALYLIYLFVAKHDAPFMGKLISVLLMAPIFILAPTTLNLEGFDYTNCDREAIEGVLWHYTYAVELIFVVWLTVFVMERIRRGLPRKERNEALLLTIGTLLFLLTFSWGNLTGSFSFDWTIAQYGLFGMPIFLGFIVYVMVKYHAFEAKLIGAEALVLSLWVLLLSLLFLQTIDTARPIIIITLALFAVLGFQLVRSVEREISQRKHIEELAKNLAQANVRLRELDKRKSEFVSVASHQLRSPLTALTGYSSMLLEGAFGKLPAAARDAVQKMFESCRLMAVSVDDFLNVTRIEQGRMQYLMEDFVINDVVKQCIAELSHIAQRHGLELSYDIAIPATTLHGDMGKAKQILTNLIDNAVKYTKQGSVAVTLADGPTADTVAVKVSDTGIGLSPEDIDKLFQKFARAENANDVSVKGTGLGLFIAREMARAQGGDIRVASEGRGKGSTFTAVFPRRAVLRDTHTENTGMKKEG